MTFEQVHETACFSKLVEEVSQIVTESRINKKDKRRAEVALYALDVGVHVAVHKLICKLPKTEPCRWCGKQLHWAITHNAGWACLDLVTEDNPTVEHNCVDPFQRVKDLKNAQVPASAP